MSNAIIHYSRLHNRLFVVNFSYIILLITISTVIPPCRSEIKDTRIVDDSCPMIVFERFGFGQEGHVKVTVNGISWRSKQQNSKLDPFSSSERFPFRESSTSPDTRTTASACSQAATSSSSSCSTVTCTTARPSSTNRVSTASFSETASRSSKFP
ncbi:hypothetical protein Nepgr_014929 [Nepenthes gracilis]|uniref:CAND6/7 N-terminal domain-containing protein n=1 Tax=Nepenthes gracilis TaxID=150966 RepID=A0AAD3SKZ9_NEPGR|nr:hypothetical protein Nepgr_014929 [Nepenthes gracilis]